MFGVIYLILAFLLGKEITEGLLIQNKIGAETEGNRFWFVLPASFGAGTLIMTWGVYVVSWIFSVCAGVVRPLLYGNLLMMAAVGGILIFLYRGRRKTRSQKGKETGTLTGEKIFSGCGTLVSDRKLFYKEAGFFFFLLVFITWIMFYVFYIRDGVLYSGFTVYGDYAPHTAMMRSFSWGNNFPTQYPHYGGADVKYHFMFQFLAGNLEYLGIRLDFAYNIVSIFSLLGFLMVLYKLAGRIVGSFAGGMLASLFFFFRSGTAFFRFAWEHLMAGDLWETLVKNTSFLGYTPNEDWGLWNFNVYLNQRHLAFGMLFVAVALWIYLDWLEAGASHEEKGMVWIKNRLFTKEAWRSRNLDTALMIGMLLGLCSFWNGAAVIGGLLILMGFAFFSDGKGDYAVTAAVAVFFAMLQSKIFVNGSVMSPSLYLGFLAEDKSLLGILWYVVQISGFFFLGLILPALFLKRRERAVMVSFLFPAVFAFMVSLTPDINVNHKYVMISYAFLTMFWAWAAVKLFSGKWVYKAGAVILVICLSLNGLYDFVVILKDNDSRHRVAVETESPLSKWIAGNLDKDDLLLTPEYSMNQVTMSGAMMYCGWPYYAWSAGYDTNSRAENAVVIYTTQDRALLKRTVEQEGIDYILFEEGMEFEQHTCREDIIAQTYPMVYNSEDGRIRIYET